ncbi:MAG: hypothetical protein Q8K60_04195, partial [Parachlamydiaceae bacterium]|nr:hypothetical protein [Parachlamydiaceae bacterium]
NPSNHRNHYPKLFENLPSLLNAAPTQEDAEIFLIRLKNISSSNIQPAYLEILNHIQIPLSLQDWIEQLCQSKDLICLSIASKLWKNIHDDQKIIVGNTIFESFYKKNEFLYAFNFFKKLSGLDQIKPKQRLFFLNKFLNHKSNTKLIETTCLEKLIIYFNDFINKNTLHLIGYDNDDHHIFEKLWIKYIQILHASPTYHYQGDESLYLYSQKTQKNDYSELWISRLENLLNTCSKDELPYVMDLFKKIKIAKFFDPEDINFDRWELFLILYTQKLLSIHAEKEVQESIEELNLNPHTITAISPLAELLSNIFHHEISKQIDEIDISWLNKLIQCFPKNKIDVVGSHFDIFFDRLFIEFQSNKDLNFSSKFLDIFQNSSFLPFFKGNKKTTEIILNYIQQRTFQSDIEEQETLILWDLFQIILQHGRLESEKSFHLYVALAYLIHINPSPSNKVINWMKIKHHSILSSLFVNKFNDEFEILFSYFYLNIEVLKMDLKYIEHYFHILLNKPIDSLSTLSKILSSYPTNELMPYLKTIEPKGFLNLIRHHLFDFKIELLDDFVKEILDSIIEKDDCILIERIIVSKFEEYMSLKQYQEWIRLFKILPTNNFTFIPIIENACTKFLDEHLEFLSIENKQFLFLLQDSLSKESLREYVKKDLEQTLLKCHSEEELKYALELSELYVIDDEFLWDLLWSLKLDRFYKKELLDKGLKLFENKFFHQNNQPQPIFANAMMILKNHSHPLINDSDIIIPQLDQIFEYCKDLDLLLLTYGAVFESSISQRNTFEDLKKITQLFDLFDNNYRHLWNDNSLALYSYLNWSMNIELNLLLKLNNHSNPESFIEFTSPLIVGIILILLTH